MSTELKLVDSVPGLAEVAQQIAIERKALLLEVKVALDRDDYARAKSLMGELVNDETKGYRVDQSKHGGPGSRR